MSRREGETKRCTDRLQVNRDLINVNFEGYKLSLDSLPMYKLDLASGLDMALVTDDQYSYQYLKAFGNHNHLFSDAWNSQYVWFVDKTWTIYRAEMIQESKRLKVDSCYTIGEAASKRLISGRLNVTLCFASKHYAVVSDGTGWLYLVFTGDRSALSAWKECGRCEPLGAGVGFTVIDSVEQKCEEAGSVIDVVCLHVDKKSLDASHGMKNTHVLSSDFITKLQWITLSTNAACSFNMSRLRTIECTSCPQFVAIHHNASRLIVITDKTLKFIHDSVKAIVTPSLPNEFCIEQQEKAYTWSQREEEVTVTFHLSSHGALTKSHIDFTLDTRHLQVNLNKENDSVVLISGNLFDVVSVQDSTWTLTDNNILEIVLFKSVPAQWQFLIEGDDRGEPLFDNEKLAEINEQLSIYTSDTLKTCDESSQAAFNTEQLEECDALSDDDFSVWSVCADSHQVIQQMNISSHQWLFHAGSPSPGEYPVICLRHDVDGIIWQPKGGLSCGSDESESLCWQHVSTFNALGYVHASKQQRKFMTCCPDFSYCVIADCVRHVYVYYQMTRLVCPLRNRKTGETVQSIAKQHLISLDTTENIRGLHATNSNIFVLSDKTLFAISVVE